MVLDQEESKEKIADSSAKLAESRAHTIEWFNTKPTFEEKKAVSAL